MKRTPKVPRNYPPIECPPCVGACLQGRHCPYVKTCPPCTIGCDQLFDQASPDVCVHQEPIISDRLIGWALVAIAIALLVFALIGWI